MKSKKINYIIFNKFHKKRGSNEKIIISICLGLILSYTTYANSSLISIGVEVPWGTTFSYEHNIGENGLKGYYSTLSGDIDSTTIDATSIGASYTLYGKKVFKGFYFGPELPTDH